MTLDEELLALARSQRGMLTTAQVERVGLDGFAMADAVRRGGLLHPGRGLYAVPHLVDVASPESWHKSLAVGARLLYPDAIFTGVTAVLAQDVAVWGCDLTRPAIMRPVHRSAGMKSFWVRRMRGPVVETELGPASGLAHALLQSALDNGITPGVVSADNALHRKLVTGDGLVEAMAGMRNWPLSHRGRTVIELSCALRESVGESRCGVDLALAGIPVIPQVEVRDAFGNFVARVDFLVAETKVVVEFDGKIKFASGDPEVLWAEKRREDNLRRLGYTVVRVTWADLERPGAVAAKVRSALKAA